MAAATTCLCCRAQAVGVLVDFGRQPPSNRYEPAGTPVAGTHPLVLGHRLHALRPGEHLAEMQRQRIDGDVVALARHAHERHAALGAGQSVAELDNRGLSGVVNEMVQPSRPGDFTDPRAGVLAAGVDQVGGPHLLRELQAIVVQVDCDQRIGSDERRCLHNVHDPHF